MKILHLSTFDIIGGATCAAYRVHQGLRDVGDDSYLLVQQEASSDRTFIAPKNSLGQMTGRIRTELNGLAIRSCSNAN